MDHIVADGTLFQSLATASVGLLMVVSALGTRRLEWRGPQRAREEPSKARASRAQSSDRGGCRTILVATDGSTSARHAVECAVQLAKATGDPLRLVGVWTLPVAISAFEPLTDVTRLEEDERRSAQVAVRSAAQGASSSGVATSTTVRHGETLAEICAEAEACGARLLVVGAQGSSGAHGAPIGSVALELLAHAPCPVLVVRGDRMPAE